MNIDVQKVSAAIAECAEKFILPRFKMLQDHEISTKSGPNDLVTQADIDVEEFMTRVLPGFYPGSTVLGEEAVASGKSSVDMLKDSSAAVWVLDPVDGTYNFVHQRREFGVMLAFVKDGQTQMSWIYDVPARTMATAARGAGAFINGKKLSVSKESEAAKLSGFINPWFFPKKYEKHLREAESHYKKCRSLRCAAHEYLAIARGEAHFSLYSRVKPWDHLPGILMVEEAGGYAAKWDKQPYAPQDSASGLIISSGNEVWDDVFARFMKPIC